MYVVDDLVLTSMLSTEAVEKMPVLRFLESTTPSFLWALIIVLPIEIEMFSKHLRDMQMPKLDNFSIMLKFPVFRCNIWAIYIGNGGSLLDVRMLKQILFDNFLQTFHQSQMLLDPRYPYKFMLRNTSQHMHTMSGGGSG